MRPRLSPEDARLWRRVVEEVRPMRGGQVTLPTVRAEPVEALPSPPQRLEKRKKGFDRLSPNGGGSKPVHPPKAHANTLDASWDKRLAKGTVSPDRTIDLHGHGLASAHALLDHALGEAVRHDARLVLLVTGRPARDNPRLPPTSRGVIRASVMDWLAAGNWGSHIAAVRNAHPRHGGAGAMYVVLKRRR